MTIEIIENELQETDQIFFWASWLEISDGVDTFLLPTTAPGSLAEGDLQGYYEAKEVELFAIAQTKGIQPDDIYTRLTVQRIAKALALVTLDEINILRVEAGLVPRTPAQLRQAVKNKLQSF